MKKLIVVLLTCLMTVSLAACGGGIAEKGINENSLSIKDFQWNVKKGYISGTEQYIFSLKNNSKYDLLGAEINYAPKKSASNTDLSVFDSFMKAHQEDLDSDISVKDVKLRAFETKLIKKEKKVDKLPLYITCQDYDWDDLVNEAQFELMEPEKLSVAVVGEDKKLYMAYYDFKDEEWSIDENVEELNTWPDNDLAKKVPKPENEYYHLTSDVDSDFLDFTIYGASSNDYKEYVKKLKEKGFTVNANGISGADAYYSADDKNGNSVVLSFSEETNNIEVSTFTS